MSPALTIEINNESDSLTSSHDDVDDGINLSILRVLQPNASPNAHPCLLSLTSYVARYHKICTTSRSFKGLRQCLQLILSTRFLQRFGVNKSARSSPFKA